MIRAQDQEIQSLIADIRDGKLLLPEMQRSYVWKSTQVRDLFDSLYREYPSGQLLIWETDELPIAGNRAASVEGITMEQRRPQLLLDGQQRLTSLTAIMLGRSLQVRDVSKSIDIAFNVYTERFEVAGPRQRAQTGWISLTKLFTEGVMAVFLDLNLDHKSPEAKKVLECLSRLDNIKKYKYRVNVLERLNYDEVTDIFVRINSGGTTLGYADLALAQVSSSWQGITGALEEYRQAMKKAYPGLQLDHGLLLRSIVAILTGQSHFTRLFRGERQHITIDELKSAWEKAKKAFDQSVAFLVHNCLIDRLDLLPTRNIFIPLVVFFNRFGAQATNTQLRELQRWVYMALIWSRYSASSESAMDQDIAALGKENPVLAMIQNIENTVGHQRLITEHELQDQRKNSPYMLMAYVLARRAHAQDWFTGVVIGNTPNSGYYLHYIFPKTLLSEKYKLREDSRIVDQVANLIFLAAPLKPSEAKRGPLDYLPKIDEQRLKAQYVPLDRNLWKLNQFEECMRQRRTMLADAINHYLQSLTNAEQLIVYGPLDIIDRRITTLEHQMRHLVAQRLIEARGEDAWEQLVPGEVRASVASRIKKQEANKPYEQGAYQTLAEKLNFCLFSDYFKIIQKTNWPLFEDVFGSEAAFRKYGELATEGRNAIKHGHTLTHVDLSATEAGLSWLEACLDKIKFEDESSEEEEDMAESA